VHAHVAQQLSGMSRHRVQAFGTCLDERNGKSSVLSYLLNRSMNESHVCCLVFSGMLGRKTRTSIRMKPNGCMLMPC
jgi:hypothetical protein